MFCPKCGSANADYAYRCASCGEVVQIIGAIAPPTKLGDDAALRWVLPVGRSWVAIAAGYAGLFAVLCFPAPVALGLGIWALSDLKKHPDKHGKGRAIFGIVMGSLGTLGLAALFVFTKR
jgi:Domain of unknown function (DUF4190)